MPTSISSMRCGWSRSLPNRRPRRCKSRRPADVPAPVAGLPMKAGARRGSRIVFCCRSLGLHTWWQGAGRTPPLVSQLGLGQPSDPTQRRGDDTEQSPHTTLRLGAVCLMTADPPSRPRRPRALCRPLAISRVSRNTRGTAASCGLPKRNSNVARPYLFLYRRSSPHPSTIQSSCRTGSQIPPAAPWRRIHDFGRGLHGRP